MKAQEPVYYSDYLALDKILNSQETESGKHGKPAHDETLFIIIHQVYELWFKQILFELDSIMDEFKQDYVDEKVLGPAIARLGRITEIQKVLISQLNVLETMTPLDFLEFRDYLTPASGFQSLQFRLVEIKLGLKEDQRLQLGRAPFYSKLTDEHKNAVTQASSNPTMFELLERWLERTPFLKFEEFDFWKSYKNAVDKMLGSDKEIIENNPTLSSEIKQLQLNELEKTRENFDNILNSEKYNSLLESGQRRLSHKASLSSILIFLYRDNPILHLPYKLLVKLIEIDENFSLWRYRHAIMVHRMIGSKIGTGGSSGHQYLKSAAENHRIFTDLFNLSTFLLPRSEIPELPEKIEKELGYFYQSKK